MLSKTHVSGHILDLIISRDNKELDIDTPNATYFISDHAFVECNLSLARPSIFRKSISYRRLKNIDTVKFNDDILKSELYCLASLYHSTLSDLLDIHAPLTTKTIIVRPSVPWMNSNIKQLKRDRRKAERKWRALRNDPIKSDQLRHQFKLARNACRMEMDSARCSHYSDKIIQCAGDQKKLFTLINNLTKPMQQAQYPECDSLEQLASAFGNFFISKIEQIRSDLDSQDVKPIILPSVHLCEEDQLNHFQLLSIDDVRKLIKRSPNKQCESDPIPTWLLKICIDSLLPILTSLINQSLQLGYFPEEWKNALVTPLLKKLGLELIFPNFRPVSNLSFISKLTERASVDQLTTHMEQKHPLPSHQSAYRPYHSTETALLKVQSDILMNMDKQRVTLLVMLDLSAAFDTIDHNILLQTLKEDAGINHTALQWFTSYLHNRTQQVRVAGMKSETFSLATGVPQGSCLSPVLFTIYIAALFRIIENHLPDAHGYADDHQLYLSFKPAVASSQAEALSATENCITDIRAWMITNKLKMNDRKTEFLLIGSRQQLERVNIPSIRVGTDNISPITSVRNLGAIFDNNMKMDKHLSKACAAAYFHLYNIKRIRTYLTQDAATMITHAFIVSQIDYCNSLMNGLPAYLIKKLQRVQNSAARLVLQLRKYDRITPAFITLHWLPVKYRIKFKSILLVHKGLHGMAPSYIRELLIPATSDRYHLRSNQAITLRVPKYRHDTFGGRAFAVHGPSQWNNLPKGIRLIKNFDAFKSELKTHFFKKFVNDRLN